MNLAGAAVVGQKTHAFVVLLVVLPVLAKACAERIRFITFSVKKHFIKKKLQLKLFTRLTLEPRPSMASLQYHYNKSLETSLVPRPICTMLERGRGLEPHATVQGLV